MKRACRWTRVPPRSAAWRRHRLVIGTRHVQVYGRAQRLNVLFQHPASLSLLLVLVVKQHDLAPLLQLHLMQRLHVPCHPDGVPGRRPHTRGVCGSNRHEGHVPEKHAQRIQLVRKHNVRQSIESMPCGWHCATGRALGHGQATDCFIPTHMPRPGFNHSQRDAAWTIGQHGLNSTTKTTVTVQSEASLTLMAAMVALAWC